MKKMMILTDPAIEEQTLELHRLGFASWATLLTSCVTSNKWLHLSESPLSLV